MSSDNNNNNATPSSPPTMGRRASYAPGQSLSELFGRTPPTGGAFPGSMAAAAANASASQRRMSISSIGLSGSSPTQTSPFATGRPRKESQSSTASFPPGDESAIDESGDAPGPSPTSFTRRLSFGARAMRDVRGGGAGVFGNGRAPTSHSKSKSISASAASSGAFATEAPASSRGTCQRPRLRGCLLKPPRCPLCLYVKRHADCNYKVKALVSPIRCGLAPSAPACP